jgi:pseudaminic acid biosynthesis-associated methylase
VTPTEQEEFWAGEFGDCYLERNQGEAIVAANTALFGRILSRCPGVASVIEFGANIGLNLVAIRRLLPEARLKAVEINRKAVSRLARLGGIEVEESSLLAARQAEPFDLAFTKTVLIHIAPDQLGLAYDVLYQSSRRYLMVAEYYNPTPVEVRYRGHDRRLFKRDFAGELLDRYSDLRLLDYGFVYHRDAFRQDDLTWFLMRKKTAS